MAFLIRLDSPAGLRAAAEAQVKYDPEADDATSVIHDICADLEGAGVRFQVSAAGEPRWPVSVETDLAVVVEQLPQLLHALGQKQAATLEFFEQGIEKRLIFRPEAAGFELTCAPLLAKPGAAAPKSTFLGPAEVLTPLADLARDFLRLAEKVSPKKSQEPMFAEWAALLRAYA